MGVRTVTNKKELAQLLEIYRPYVEQTAISFEYETPSLPEFIHRWESSRHCFPWLLYEEQGEILGFAYAGEVFSRAAYAWCAELTVYIKREARGQGIGRILYAALEERLEQLGYRILYARVTGMNAGSIRFHETMGYKTVAVLPQCGWKHGEWHDLVWMEKRVGPNGAPGPKPAADDSRQA